MNEPTNQNQNQETAVTTADRKPPVAIGPHGIQLTNIEEMWRFAGYVMKSNLAPRDIKTQEAIFVALEMGLEIGLPPMASLQNICVINGRPSVWGDVMLAVCRNTKELEVFEEWYEQGGKRCPRNPVHNVPAADKNSLPTFSDDTTAVCRVKRKGSEPIEHGFSVMDAKTAKLWGKDSPWSTAPTRMLRARARGFVLRDAFGDALKGLRSAEEVGDDPVELAKVVPSEFIPKKRDKTPAAEKAPVVNIESETVAQTEPAKEAATETKPTDPTQTIGELQTRFREFCTEHAAPFGRVRDWLAKADRWPNADAAESWGDVPDATINGLLAAAKDAAKMVNECGRVA